MTKFYDKLRLISPPPIHSKTEIRLKVTNLPGGAA